MLTPAAAVKRHLQLCLLMRRPLDNRNDRHEATVACLLSYH
ncbi:hypothetical protein AcetOrient_orf00135p (plasmid) [Acetobacter orientalis]|uniref:Uncharacterized protein n=1 Tax=Acetobacter orientalis TaxID=146474 RepID=A0A2Z5ZMP6_9PROT|nr:hypothetical protein AcetOrient_orf00135p [Acetobacter orientalis]